MIRRYRDDGYIKLVIINLLYIVCSSRWRKNLLVFVLVVSAHKVEERFTGLTVGAFLRAA